MFYSRLLMPRVVIKALLQLSLSAAVFQVSTAQSLEILSEWQQGAMVQGRVTPGTQVEFLGRKVRVGADGLFVVGLGRDASETAALVTIDDQGRHEHHFAVKQRQYRIQRVEGVPNRTVNPSPEQVKRSKAEAAMAWRARQRESDRRDFTKAFKWPVIGPITGVYGSQRIYNGEPRRPHYGVDVAAPTGTAVRAPASGFVTLAHNDMFFSGGTLIVDHGYGISSTFIHLSKIHVEEGQEITQGQLIAEVGATGRATGPHLDWRMNWFDQRLDPVLVVGPMPKQISSAPMGLTAE